MKFLLCIFVFLSALSMQTFAAGIEDIPPHERKCLRESIDMGVALLQNSDQLVPKEVVQLDAPSKNKITRNSVTNEQIKQSFTIPFMKGNLLYDITVNTDDQCKVIGEISSVYAGHD